MKNSFIMALVLVGVLTGSCFADAGGLPYFYPFVNPFEATVIPMPAAYKYDYTEKVPTKRFKLEVFPDREISEAFWYTKGLTCSLSRQKHEAPLLFIVAGTGAHYNSPKMVDMKHLFYEAGFHVVCITSPTHMNFVVNATSGMPGNTPEDAKDLYRVMEMADAYARKKKTKISGYALTGYSLGALQSAFLTKLDDERGVFNFERTLLINPPADVYDSINILDDLMTKNVPGGMDNFPAWFRDALSKIAADAEAVEGMTLTPESIYRLYRYYPPEEDFLKILIGFAFRISSGNMIFTVDAMNGGGYILPKNTKLTTTTSLTPYAMASYNASFVDYFNELFFPFYRQKEPGLTKDALIERASLYSLEPYLRDNDRIGLLHNEDDVIMAPGQVDYLQEVFGDRARVFPIGGHCGNMGHPDVTRFMVDFLSGKEVAK